MMELTCEDIDVAIGTKTVLHGVRVAIRPGLLTGILGCNGAGKSTLLRTLLGYIQPSRGAILLGGRPLGGWGDRERAARVAYIAQGYSVQWPMQVEHVVALGRMPYGYGRGMGVRGLNGRDRRRVEAAMANAGVGHLGGRGFDTLSGGERARVMLARALVGEPAVLLADEPLAGLDPAYQLRVSTLLRQQARIGRAVALVLHDLSIAARFCDEIVLLHKGRVLAAGAPRAVLTRDNLSAGFGIEAKQFDSDGEQYMLPWRACVAGPVAGVNSARSES